MQLLSSITDLKDIVNKEYIDNILTNYVLKANLGALATKDSLAFSDLTSRPSKLSDFTDDVVAGKYLPLIGGTLTGGLTISSGNLIISSGGGDTVTNKLYPSADNTYFLGQESRRWSDIKTVLINGGTPIHSGNIGTQSVASAGYATNAAKLAGYDITQVLPQILQSYRYIEAGTDLDTLIEENAGWWNSRDNTDYTNGPKQNFGLFSARINTSFFGQLAFGYSSSELMYRSQSWGSSGKFWESWKTIAFTDSNVASAQALTHSNGTVGAVVNSSGNVTIGDRDLAQTNYKLYVGGKLRTQYINLEGGNEINCFLDNGDSAPLCLNWGSRGNILLGIGGGYVGIGITSPAYKLDVAGSIRTTSSLTIGTIVLTDENGTLKIAGNAYTTGQLATGEAGHSTSGGGSVQYWSNEYDMDIGTDVLVSSKDYIGTNTIVGWDSAGSCVGDLYVGYDGYTIWMQGSVDEASDMRLKTVIDAVNLDIRDIAYAPIFNYVFKSRPQGRQMLGSSAQYWQAIAPKAVSENDKGNLAMNYGAIALASVVAVAKETLTQREEIATQREEIANLKLKVQSLEQRLAQYES